MDTYKESFRFGEFTLTPSKRTLFRERIEIKLRDKEFDVLAFLIESAPKTRSHDEIIKTVWNGTAVENNSVDKAITNIRKILGDDVKKPRFIKTIRSKGYLFIGDINETHDIELVQKHSENELNNLLNKHIIWKKLRLISAILILISISGALWWKSEYIWTRLTQKVIFADDFSGSEINTNLWRVKGNNVVIEDGIAKIVVKETENQPKLDSVLFSFDRNKPVIIRSRQKVSYSKNLKDRFYFMGYMGITPKTPLFNQVDVHNEYIFGVHYTNHDYESRYPNGDLDNMKAEGFFLFKNCGGPYKKIDYRDGKISGRIEPVWGEWFDQKIIYNPLNGDMSYFINDNLKEVFNVGNLLEVMDEDKLKIEIFPTGWWTNHSIELDYIEITQ